MRGVNKVILVGNLGKEPEVQYLESGTCVAKFPLATTESYKDKSGNRVDQTEWHNIVLWRGLAEVAEKYLHKGSGIYLEGRLKTRSWDDREGNKRYTTEIVGENFIMLDRKNGDGGMSDDRHESSSSGMGDQQSHSSMGTPATSNMATEPSSAGGWSSGGDTANDLPF